MILTVCGFNNLFTADNRQTLFKLAYILIMASLFSFAPFMILGAGFAVIALTLNSRVLNAMLIISPNVIVALYPPLTGQILQSISVGGSVISRIQLMVIFGAPFIVGVLGTLNQLKVECKTTPSSPTSGKLIVGVIALASILNLISVLLLRPENGQGRSIYVPVFGAILSLASIWVLSGPLVPIALVQTAVELMVIYLYSFLIFDCFFNFANWYVQPEVFQGKQLDQFRFSPLESVLNIQGRQAFFESDPENFAAFSVFALVIVLSSERKFIKYFGSVVVFAIASTTQSRLFYLAASIVVILKLALFALKPMSNFIKRFSIIILFLVYYFLLIARDNSKTFTGLGSLSGRTGIWNIVINNWSDQGALLGNQGVYSLLDFSLENSRISIVYHSHNMVLQYLWDWGILGLALILVFMVALFFVSTKVSSAGFFLIVATLLTGLIEPSVPNSILVSKFIFLLMVVKHAAEPISIAVHENQFLRRNKLRNSDGKSKS
jgi:hypothetical protein